jgi:hemolysin activation/secretion protein
MYYLLCLIFLFFSSPVSAQNVAASQSTQQLEPTLIRNISMEGFLLEDKGQFVKLFKSYRNKYLSRADMDMILQKIEDVYVQEGFQQLVSITYAVNNHHLIFTVSMTS